VDKTKPKSAKNNYFDVSKATALDSVQIRNILIES